MSSLKVTSPPEKLREYDGKHGQLVVWGFDVAGEGRVELHKKPDNAPPTVGSIVLGNVKEMEHAGQPFKRLYLDKPTDGFNMGGGSDSNSASIEKQVAMKGAVELVVHGKAEISELGELTSTLYRAIRDAG